MQQKESNLLGHDLSADLYQQYAARLFAYAYQQIASREEAEDIVIETFLSVLQNKHFATFSEERQEAWLWTVIRNKVVDYRRRTLRRPSLPIAWLTEPLYADNEQGPEQISLKREEYARLNAIVETLPELQQEVLRLRFGHGLKCEEIAPVIKKSEGAVRMLLSRTLRRLRSIYTDLGKER